MFKTGIFAALAGLAFFLFNQFGGKKTETSENIPAPIERATSQAPPPLDCQVPDDLFPDSEAEIVRHTWYALGYSEDHEQAEWVAYELTLARLKQQLAERSNTFRPDPDVRTESATPRDYSSSGYDKGHLCPAADMTFSAEAMDETFFYE